MSTLIARIPVCITLAGLMAWSAMAQLPPPPRPASIPPPKPLVAPDLRPMPVVVPALRPAPELRPMPMAVTETGTLTPNSGRWHTFVAVKGPGFGAAERVSVSWYPGDNDSQPLGGQVTATLRKRTGADEVEIEMPAGAGGSIGAVVRVYVHMANTLRPQLAGRFTITDGTRVLPPPAVVRPMDGEVKLRPNNLPVPVIVKTEAEGPTKLRIEFTQAASSNPAIRNLTIGAIADGITTPEVTANVPGSASGTAPASHVLGGLMPGITYDIYVRANFTDGQFTPSKITRVEMPAAQNPPDLAARVTALNRVTLTWSKMEGALHYIVEGSNLERRETKDNWQNIDGVMPGDHEWRVITVYGPAGIYNVNNPATVRLAVAGDQVKKARYRLTINGFRVNHVTHDDLFSLDGKGDEVFLAFRVFPCQMYAPDWHAKSTCERGNVQRTGVFGDKNGFPGAERFMAGSSSAAGGLRNGDTYPGPNPAERSRPLTTGDLPQVIWEGEFEPDLQYTEVITSRHDPQGTLQSVRKGSKVFVVPSIWEWDRGELLDDIYDDWQYRAWSGPPGQTPDYEFFQHRWELGGANCLTTACGPNPQRLDQTRPIGAKPQPSTNSRWFSYEDKKLELTYESAARILSENPSGRFSFQLTDPVIEGLELGGDYTIYLQLELVTGQ